MCDLRFVTILQVRLGPTEADVIHFFEFFLREP